MKAEDRQLRDALVQPFEEATRLAEAELEKRRAANVMLVEPPDTGTPQGETQPARAGRKMAAKKVRGIFEKVKGSGIWWIRYADGAGRVRYEKGGAKGMAETLYHKRKTEVLQRRKLPELGRKAVQFRELLEDAVAYAKENHQTNRERDYRADLLIELLGGYPAESITPQHISRELSRIAREREWAPASYNRFKAFVSLAFRLGIENNKVTSNPARFVRRRREDNEVIRWLTADEETKLRAAIQSDYPDEVPTFDVSLHTGMRQSEQYRLTWNCVDLERRQVTIPRSKHGGIRYIPLDNTALAAFVALRARTDGPGPVMVLAESGHGYKAGHALKTPKEWFMACCQKAGIQDFTWHCLRHTFASRLVMAGVPLRKVQELMGHKTIAMTCRYAHLAPEHLQDAVLKLDGWGQKPTESKTETGPFEGSLPVEALQTQVVLQ